MLYYVHTNKGRATVEHPWILGPFDKYGDAEDFAVAHRDPDQYVWTRVVKDAAGDPCECKGHGYFTSESDADGLAFLERCDQCQRFKNDDEAAAQWALDLAHGLPWALEYARTMLAQHDA